ncbi:MAG: SbcC/MukB-like Walker B domain-containing protein, partial [Saprospiraceae bacterium]|nr:SbcC/MukB-like Walker B domain-containing protein [Saprospiraceae bacterium]
RQEEQKQFRLQIANETEIRKGHTEWLKLQDKLSQMDAVAINFHQFESRRQEPLLAIEAEKASLQTELLGLETKEKESRVLESKLHDLQREVEESQQAVAADEKQLEMRSTLESDLLEISAEKARAKAENVVLKTEMDELDTRRKALREIHGAACPTCEKPLLDDEKEHIIADLTARGTQKAEIYRKNLKTLEQCDALYREKETSLISLQAVEADLKLQHRLFDSRSEELKRGQDEVEKWLSVGSKRLEEIRKKLNDEDFAEAARKQLLKIDQELKKLGYDASSHAKLKAREQAGREFQAQLSMLEQSKSALAPLDREISALEKSIDAAEKHLSAIEQDYKVAYQKLSDDQTSAPDLAELERNNRDLHEQANQLLSEVGSAKNKVEVLTNIRQQKAAKEEEKQVILQKIAQLKMLERAFGKDGIPALLIEHEIPNIAEQANKILGNLSFDEMKIDFRTQKNYRDEKREDRKETLDIIISSGGVDREYELLSGGEAFRVNFAVRLALSRVLANRAGARLRTLVIDEGFGSQDA